MKNLLEKHFSKKTLRLLTIGAGVGVIVFYFIIKSIMDSFMSSWDFDSIGAMAYVSLFFYIAFIVVTVLILYYSYRIYFKNNDKSDVSVVVTFGIFCAFAVILLLNFQTIMFFLKLASITSIYDLYDLGYSVDSVDFAYDLLRLGSVAVIGIAGYSIYMLNKEKGTVQAGPQQTTTTAAADANNTATTTAGAEATNGSTAQTTGSPEPTNTSSTSTTGGTPEVEKKPNETVQKIKGFISTKKGKMILGGVAAALVVVLVAVNLISNQKTEVDLTKGVEIEFSGTDGEGYAYVADNKWAYDGNSKDVEDFLDGVYFSIDNDDDLSNGDEITVTAKYYDEDAKKYKVAPTNTEKTFKVKGLDVEYSSYDDLTKKEKTTVEDSWAEYFEDGTFEDDVRDDLYYDFKSDPEMTLSDMAVVARYYGDSEYAGDDVIVYVVKVTAKGTERYGDAEKTITKYYKIELSEITPSTLKYVDSSTFYLSYSGGLDADTDEKAKKEVIKAYEQDGWDEYEMTEIK
ncbi:hypothetical protein [Breznakia pachnodae]|uniref:Uncharacterized protein n=1 Tax=Breznakia pachnodae TaxID=265178 RepID=A0ABU0E1S5_9FIRM|nr:hypothetical protein [Breznakia pachnodae]MDQ0360841.1 hypothetical protein [Breznakia pachnodae]